MIRRMPVRAVVLLLFLGFVRRASAQQPYEVAVSGQFFTCGITTPFVLDYADFHLPHQEKDQF